MNPVVDALGAASFFCHSRRQKFGSQQGGTYDASDENANGCRCGVVWAAMVVWRVFTSGNYGTLTKDMPANVETRVHVAIQQGAQ